MRHKVPARLTPSGMTVLGLKALSHRLVIPAEAKRRAGTLVDSAAQDPGSADAVRDDSDCPLNNPLRPQPFNLCITQAQQAFQFGFGVRAKSRRGTAWNRWGQAHLDWVSH